MRKHWLYLKYIYRHKLYVFVEGRKMGLGIVQMLIHDWQKFTFAEWSVYARTFYGDQAAPRRADGGYDPSAVSEEFDRAWHHHVSHGPHHWQYWALAKVDGGMMTLEIPDVHRREMVADWRGAGRAIKGHGPEKVAEETLKWYVANRDNMQLHPKTRTWVEAEIGYGA